MAIHYSILAWEIPRPEEPGRLQSMWLQRVRHAEWLNTYTFTIATFCFLSLLCGRHFPHTMHSTFASHLCSFSRAAVTKYQNLDGLQQQEFIGSQFWKSEVHTQGVSRPMCSLTSLGESLPCLFLDSGCCCCWCPSPLSGSGAATDPHYGSTGTDWGHPEVLREWVGRNRGVEGLFPSGFAGSSWSLNISLHLCCVFLADHPPPPSSSCNLLVS